MTGLHVCDYGVGQLFHLEHVSAYGDYNNDVYPDHNSLVLPDNYGVNKYRTSDFQHMDQVTELMEYLRTVEGVIDVFEMDDTISNEIWDIEKSVRTTVRNEYKNVGFDIAMQRGHRLCVFYNDTYIFGKRSIVKLMSSDGTIMGTSLHPDEIESYKGRDDIIWISEDFIVFPHIVGSGEEAFVLYPIDIPEIHECVPCCCNVIGTSPTMSSDAALKDRFDKPNVSGIYTMVIAFD